MSSVLKNGSYDVLIDSEINNTQTSIIGKNEPITKRYEVLKEQLEIALVTKEQAINVIVDSRKDWMIKEDREMACMSRCPLHRKCVSKHGPECKRLGGNEIPKIRY